MGFRCAILLAFAVVYATASTVKPEERKCGVYKPGGLVKANGTPDPKHAGLGEFPWTVAIFKSNVITCAGSLIQPNVVLTAAHCVKDVKKEDLKIKAGLWNVNTKNQQYPSEERAVSQIVSHPEFVNDGKQIKNDIALIVLEKPFDLADHIGLACVAKKDHVEKSKVCYAAGWGKESQDGKAATVLKKMLLPTVTKEDCEKKLKTKTPNFTVPDNAICAGGDKASTCIGDGGAALTCQVEPPTENRYVQSGITSSGAGCVNEIPGVYTKVAAYRDWIDEQVRKLGLEPKRYTI